MVALIGFFYLNYVMKVRLAQSWEKCSDAGAVQHI